jgi:hypothetical protein
MSEDVEAAPNSKNTNTTKGESSQPVISKQDKSKRETKESNQFQQERRDQINKPLKGRFQRWLKRWQILLYLVVPSIFSLAIFSVVFWQSFIYRRQWQVMQEQLNQSRESREASDRPWVLVKGASLNVPIQAGKPIVPTITFVNSGKTPASRCNIIWHTAITNETAVDKFPSDVPGYTITTPPSGGILAPNVDANASSPPVTLSQEQVDTHGHA